MPLSVISLLVHAYIAWRLIPDLAGFTGWQIGVALLIIDFRDLPADRAESLAESS